ESIKKTIKKSVLGAQNMFWGDLGAYTGEISWRQLKRLGVEYVILGHSERRKYLDETDELINKKVSAALRVGLNVILCVGEPLNIRRKGISIAKKFVKSQLLKNLRSTNKLKSHLTNKLIIAYEPVWAIGTGKPDKPESAVEMSTFIKSIVMSQLSVLPPVLYGGSVDAKNAEGFLSNDLIDGALVGGASLKSKEFQKIIKISSKF
ncbi:MAG TPA: triose-phosphate isomerase, partial [Candidatus Paceibacterota bacterium]